MAKFCGKCGAPFDENGKCPNCDKKEEAVPKTENKKPKYCKKCGAKRNEDGKCPNCDKKAEQTVPPKAEVKHPNFCKKCGAKRDQDGKCPNCDKTSQMTPPNVPKPEQQPKQPKQTFTQQNKPVDSFFMNPDLSAQPNQQLENRGKNSAKKAKKKDKKKHIGIKIIAILLALLILVSGVTGTLVYLDVVDIPFVESIMKTFGIIDENTDIKESKNSNEKIDNPINKTENSKKTELKNFRSDYFDIYVGNTETATFTVEVVTETNIDENDVAIYDEEDKFIAYMNDNGENGDYTADDGIYSAQITLFSSERKNFSYYSKFENIKSDYFEVCFYSDISSEDYENFEKLTNKVFSFDTLQEAQEYLKKSKQIKEYSVSGNIITFITNSGMTAVYDTSTDTNTKANRKYSVDTSKGIDYDAAVLSLNKLPYSVVNNLNDGNVAVIRPYRNIETNFNYDDFLYAGQCISRFTGGDTTCVDDSDANVDFMKNLSGYRFVLIDSHGTMSSISNSAWDVFPTNPYILTGEIYSAGQMWSSADWQAGRIVVCGTDMFYGKGNVAVGAKFFDKYYDEGDLEESMFFLGTCYSLHNDSIASVLVKKGAKIVYGYDEPVSFDYCRETLFETVINSLLLSASTANEALQSAKDICGGKDPNVKYECNMKMYGNNDYIIALDSSPKQNSERDIVLVLDTSGSMDGEPITETKQAATKFVDTILSEDANIGIVTYSNDANIDSNLTTNNYLLNSTIENVYASGGTNIESGLSTAEEMLEKSDAEKKIIVLMSDGEPNEGKEGDELIAYADEIKENGTYIYTLGFFEDLGSEKSEAQALMEKIASEGCHYEVDDADSLVYFFGDIADQINGQKYIYVRIACPVEVKVKYDGETLCSEDDKLNTRTSFGSLTFEDVEKEENSDSDYSSDDDYDDSSENDRVKILRLKEGVDYDIKIEGTGRGKMNYTIKFMDDNGEYADSREFKNIKITKKTEIDTVATVDSKTTLKVDEDGDGSYDLTYVATENGKGKIVDYTWVYYIVAGAVLLLLILFIAVKRRKKRKKIINNF